MTKNDRQLLKQFQCDYNRSIEENFAQVLSEEERVRLFFINENEAFTDGRNIVVDPAEGDLFTDKRALLETENYLHMGHELSSDGWLALRMVTRAQTIHEALHIIYTTFPNPAVGENSYDTKAKLKAICLISNIIEDAFIEATGCSVFDNLELFLKFGRVSRLFAHSPSEGTAGRAFKTAVQEQEIKTLPLVDYLDYMATFLLYPMAKQLPPVKEIEKYVADTKQFFLDGSTEGDPDARFGYAKKIYSIIEPLIPDNDEWIDTSGLGMRLGGLKTHDPNQKTITQTSHKGKTAKIIRRLFADLYGNPIEGNASKEALIRLLPSLITEKENALKIVSYQGKEESAFGRQFDSALIHKDIEIKVIKPKINLNLYRAYQNIYSRYHININSYNSRFTQLLKSRVPTKDFHQIFGSGLSSKHLGDVKKRYWYRNSEGFEVPDVAIMFLIDGSGSMSGERRESAIISSVILHEVLKKQGITHAIVEHRAIYGEPLLKHKILVDFDGLDEEKYNLLLLDADEGTREGLTLFWAERYLNEKTHSEHKLIIMLSDGVPAHDVSEDIEYMPPVSIKDTANAVIKIMNRGTDIIAIALDDSDEMPCYDELKQMYPDVVSCSDLKHLTGQLLTLISKKLFY